MHLDFIVGRVPTNGWAAAGKHPPPILLLFHSSFLHPSTRTNSPSPPPPQQEVQAWIPAGVPNSNQPTGTASGGLTHSSLSLFLSLSFYLSRSGSVDSNQLPPHVLAAHARTHTLTQRHISMIAHKCTPTTSSSSLEEPKAFRQLTKALCGLTHSRKEGECKKKGLMIKIGVCVCVYVCLPACVCVCMCARVVISHPGHLGATSKVQLKYVSNKEWERGSARLSC